MENEEKAEGTRCGKAWMEAMGVKPPDTFGETAIVFMRYRVKVGERETALGTGRVAWLRTHLPTEERGLISWQRETADGT